MGGNAMAPYGARRFSAEEYVPLLKEVIGLLAEFKPTGIPYYRNKVSFGDMDIITRSLKEEDYKTIINRLGTSTYLRNDSVMSLLYKEIQIDIIPMSEEDYSTSLLYYSYNDLGNLMGKIFHKFGVKYGHRGLVLPVKDGDYGLGEVVLSKNPVEIFRFGGFDIDRYYRGFDDLEEIFLFVITSKYFNSEIFQYENLNSINKLRDRKRPTYHAFLQYLDETSTISGESLFQMYSSSSVGHIFNEDKGVYLPAIFAHFPAAKREYEELLEQRRIRRAIKEKLNGKIVMDITGLTGSSLGSFMAFLKECMGGFGPELLDKSDDWIKGQIFETYKEWSA